MQPSESDCIALLLSGDWNEMEWNGIREQMCVACVGTCCYYIASQDSSTFLKMDASLFFHGSRAAFSHPLFGWLCMPKEKFKEQRILVECVCVCGLV